MQLEIDVTCKQTNFGGRDPSGFGDMATFQKRPNFPFRAWTIVHGHGKIESIGIGLKKFIQVGMDVKCTHTNFGGRGLSSLEKKIIKLF